MLRPIISPIESIFNKLALVRFTDENVIVDHSENLSFREKLQCEIYVYAYVIAYYFKTYSTALVVSHEMNLFSSFYLSFSLSATSPEFLTILLHKNK